MMRFLHTTAATLLAIGLGTPAARAQHSEEQEVEKVEAPKVPDTSGKRPDFAAAATAIVEQTNAFRKKEGRGPVAVDGKLAADAKDFAEFMAKNDEYGHHADGSGPGERAKRHGYEYCLIGENIAYTFSSRGYDTGPLAEEFVNGWEKSPPHRRNMLDPDVTATGSAVARSDKTGYYYAVQLFGRPKSAAVVFKVENTAGANVKYTVGGRTFDLPPRTIRTHSRCRPAELKFDWPDGKTASVKSAGGDRFRVTKGPDGFAVKKEE
jgi:uncharacterized protein YkwD